MKQQVLVRVTPGVRPNTHDFIQTGQQDSKFGFGLADGRAHEAVRRLHDAPHLELVGVHAHIGSQIFELDSYRREVEVLFVAIDDWRRDFGFECCVFNIGGGLGIRYIGQRPAQLHRRVRGDRAWGRCTTAPRGTASPCPGCSSSRAAASPARPA